MSSGTHWNIIFRIKGKCKIRKSINHFFFIFMNEGNVSNNQIFPKPISPFPSEGIILKQAPYFWIIKASYWENNYNVDVPGSTKQMEDSSWPPAIIQVYLTANRNSSIIDQSYSPGMLLSTCSSSLHKVKTYSTLLQNQNVASIDCDV